MRVFHSLDAIPFQAPTALTMGTFDGVHRGHRKIIDALTHKARRIGGRSVVLTFDPHPQEILRKTGDSVSVLTTIEERTIQLENLGVDILVVLEFTREFASTPWEHFCTLLLEKIGIDHMIVGHDHAFGRNREGNAESLRRFGEVHGFDVTEIGPLVMGDEIVSSTKIRRALGTGDIAKATDYLGRFYSVDGLVVKGDGRGRAIGIPTANLQLLHQSKLVPANGVYCIRLDVGGRTYRGMANIGTRPTFTDATTRTIEAHLFEFTDDIYHQNVTLEFLKFVRSEQKFASLDDFLKQLESDREVCTGRSVVEPTFNG